jgi:hypothetical protein
MDRFLAAIVADRDRYLGVVSEAFGIRKLKEKEQEKERSIMEKKKRKKKG